MALYIGTNYHPHDWEKERWKKDVELMAQAGFTTVRLGHLCWDSYEPEEGGYTFEAVSYTHLEGYKRQFRSCRNRQEDCPP